MDQKFWERIPVELERWFAEHPAEEAADLKARFRDKDPAQHFAAWWELYLHRLFNQLGFRVDVHPDLAEVSGRPDFRITGAESSVPTEKPPGSLLHLHPTHSRPSPAGVWSLLQVHG